MRMKRRKEEVPNEHPYEEIQLKGIRNYAFEPDDEDDVVDFDRRDLIRKNLNTDQNLPSTSNVHDVICKSNEMIINLKNVFFKYEKKQDWILNSLQINIPFGCIYSLMGSSESGKSTIIKLILGLLTPTSGTIQVFDHQIIGQMTNKRIDQNTSLPKLSIGYVPQNLALYQNLTISEYLSFYGQLYLMSKDEIKLRIKQLTCLFKFDCVNQLIDKLSNDQQHLVALASSVLHNPSLILLDELTLGLCPETCQIIRIYLNELVKQTYCTILIATSQFDEARKFSNLIGFLRRGKLLTEKSPEILLSTYSLSSLEQVYIRLCKLEKLKLKSTMDPVFLSIKQVVDNRIEDNSINLSASPSTSSLINSSTVFNSSINHHKKKVRSLNNKQLDSIRPNLVWLIAFFSQLHKNLIRLIRRRTVLVLMQFLLLPIFQLILFYFAFGRDPFNIKLGIINDNKHSAFSQLFIQNLDQYFINQLDYTDLNDAIKDVKATRLFGIIHIGQLFGDLINDRFQLNDNLTRIDIEQSNIFLHFDQSNKFIVNIVQRSLTNSFDKFVKQIIRSSNKKFYKRINNATTKTDKFIEQQLTIEKPKNFAYSSIRFKESIFGATNYQEHKTWRFYIVPRLIVNITFVMSFCFTCIQFINERKKSIIDKQFVANCTAYQIMFSHLIVQLIFTFIQTILILALTIELFNLSIKSSHLPIIICLILLVSTSGHLIGICLSFYFQKIYSIILITSASLFYLFLISGCLWPIESYSNLLRYFTLIHPTTLPSQCLENLFFRTISAGVYSGFIISILYIVLFFNLSIYKFYN